MPTQPARVQIMLRDIASARKLHKVGWHPDAPLCALPSKYHRAHHASLWRDPS